MLKKIHICCAREAGGRCIQNFVVVEWIPVGAGALHTELVLAVEEHRGFGTALLGGCSAVEQVM